MLHELPSSSLIDFPVYRLKNAEIAWVNPILKDSISLPSGITLDDWLLSQFAYVTACYGDHDIIDLNVSKNFKADRYGADGQFCNGGSARCGIYNNYQVKGNGRNPLVSTNMDYHHSHGKLCLLEAINEAIWGEIYNSQLPYGAARTLAIIKTNTDIVTEWGFGIETKQPAALLVREIVIRPAHFMRATFFWPEKEHLYLRDNDADRVKEAVNALLQSSSRAVNYSQQRNTHAFHMINSSAQCIAKQIAVSRIKRIPHGSLSCSNIGLSGKFIDFSTAAAVQDYKNYILVNDFGGVLDDHLTVVRPWLSDLIFYINKYSNEEITRVESDKIINNFIFTVNATENIELMKLVGATIPANKAITEGGKLKGILRNESSPIRFRGYTEQDFNKSAYFIAKDANISVARDIKKLNYFDPAFMINIIDDLRSLINLGASTNQINELIDQYISKSQITTRTN